MIRPNQWALVLPSRAGRSTRLWWHQSRVQRPPRRVRAGDRPRSKHAEEGARRHWTVPAARA